MQHRRSLPLVRPTGRFVLTLGAIYLTAAVVSWFGAAAATAVQTAFPASSQYPYFAPTHAWLLYLALPLVVLAALLFWLLPGLALTLAWRPPRLARWTMPAGPWRWMGIRPWSACRLSMGIKSSVIRATANKESHVRKPHPA